MSQWILLWEAIYENTINNREGVLGVGVEQTYLGPGMSAWDGKCDLECGQWTRLTVSEKHLQVKLAVYFFFPAAFQKNIVTTMFVYTVSNQMTFWVQNAVFKLPLDLVADKAIGSSHEF